MVAVFLGFIIGSIGYLQVQGYKDVNKDSNYRINAKQSINYIHNKHNNVID